MKLPPELRRAFREYLRHGDEAAGAVEVIGRAYLEAQIRQVLGESGAQARDGQQQAARDGR